MITVVRCGYNQPLFSISTQLLELLENVPTKTSAPCFHFLFALLTRLYSDEQVVQILAGNSTNYLLCAANCLVASTQ